MQKSPDEDLQHAGDGLSILSFIEISPKPNGIHAGIHAETVFYLRVIKSKGTRKVL